MLANQRVQFREPIANFGTMHKLGEIAVKTWMHSLRCRTGKQIDIITQELVAQGQSASERINAVREYAIEAAYSFTCSRGDGLFH